jgi:two-component system LytT family response regulator
MGSAAPTYAAREPQRGCMRVVVLEPNAESRDVVRRELADLRGFTLVGEADAWDDCSALVRAHLPELLIARTAVADQSSIEATDDAAFPVVVGLGSPRHDADDSIFETLEIPLERKSLRAAMERVRTEIYRRKLDSLSILLRQYMDYSRGLHRCFTAVRVEDGSTSEIPAERVVFMAADGNYVRLHTGVEVLEVRDTMSAMTSKLDPTQFARVHRSFIVNRAYVTNVLRKEGAATSVLLNNGTEIPVGPNYRGEVESFAMLDRLSA